MAGKGAAAAKAQPRRLIVDMREFMSSLPAVLHQQVRVNVYLSTKFSMLCAKPYLCWGT